MSAASCPTSPRPPRLHPPPSTLHPPPCTRRPRRSQRRRVQGAACRRRRSQRRRVQRAACRRRRSQRRRVQGAACRRRRSHRCCRAQQQQWLASTLYAHTHARMHGDGGVVGSHFTLQFHTTLSHRCGGSLAASARRLTLHSTLSHYTFTQVRRVVSCLSTGGRFDLRRETAAPRPATSPPHATAIALSAATAA